MPGVFVLDFLTADGRCVGALARREDGEVFTIAARSVPLAAGGAGRLFRETSNVRGATGDGIAAAFRAGAEVRDVEFVQFHPTTLYLAGTERALVTEAVRGDGAYIIDNLGQRFLADVDEAAELAPRDVVSRAILDRLAEPDVTDVFLDMRHWPAGHAAERFPGLVRLCRRYGLDPERDPVPVRPAAHYFIGGVACDADGRTSLPGLFACGEASATGLHGANRLASNSLLEGLVLGRRVGRVAAAEPGPRFTGHVSHVAKRDARSDVDVADLRESLVSRMWRSVGVRREATELADAWDLLAQWRHFSARLPLFTRAAFELENLLLLGSLVTAAARLREESRGTHNRLDFPDRDDGRFLGRFHWAAGTEGRFVPIGVVTRG
jgi:L-aspartate oxidase